jgi:hypothetical protein
MTTDGQEVLTTRDALVSAFKRWHQAIRREPDAFVPSIDDLSPKEFGEAATKFLLHLLAHPKAKTGGLKRKAR